MRESSDGASHHGLLVLWRARKDRRGLQLHGWQEPHLPDILHALPHGAADTEPRPRHLLQVLRGRGAIHEGM